jgi:hypothetical protein
MKFKSQTGTNRRVLLSALVGSLICAGCVTINIYFPAAAAEKAADRIIDEVWQLKGGAPTAPAPATGAKPDAK